MIGWETQGLGRAARQGQPGSSRIIICSKSHNSEYDATVDLLQVLGISLEKKKIP